MRLAATRFGAAIVDGGVSAAVADGQRRRARRRRRWTAMRQIMSTSSAMRSHASSHVAFRPWLRSLEVTHMTLAAAPVLPRRRSSAGSFSAAADALHLAQPSLSRAGPPARGRARRARCSRASAAASSPTEAGRALRPHAEACSRGRGRRASRVVAVRELRGGTATFGTFGTARYYPGTDIVADVPPPPPERARAARRPELRPRPPRPCATATSRPAWSRCRSTTAGLDVRPIMQDEIVYASSDPRAPARPMTIERARAARR